MKIKVLHRNGTIIRVLSEAEYGRGVVKSKHTFDVLIIDDEPENEEIVRDLIAKLWKIDPNAPEYTVSGEQLLKDGAPVVLVENTVKKSLRDAYVQALADLETIQTGTVSNLTEANWALNKMSRIIERMLRLMKEMV